VKGLLEITSTEVQNSTNKFNNDEIIQKTETLLWSLFKKFPENKEPEEIAAKVLLIDRLYSTQIFKYKKIEFLSEVVENIRTITDFDERVKNGDPTVVCEIYRSFKTKMFSFATKYCCLHNTVVYGRDDYSIYDSAVHKLLPKYAKQVGEKLTGTQIERWKNTGDYKAFNDAVDIVLDKAEIKIPGRKRKFDLFLWSQRNSL